MLFQKMLLIQSGCRENLAIFDALNNSRVAVLPISSALKFNYKGSEFVGICYFIQIDKIKDSDITAIWVYEGEKYIIFDRWLEGFNPV